MSEAEYFDTQRRIVSHMTTQSWLDIPHVSYLYEPDITDFFQEYVQLSAKRSAHEPKLSFNTIMMYAIIRGLEKAPKLNSVISYNHKKAEGKLTVRNDVNICLPWLLPDGRMFTPVLHRMEAVTLSGLCGLMAELGEKVKNTNIDELLYQAVVSDTIGELKRFNLGVLRRILASKVSFHRIKGLSKNERIKYNKIPVQNRLISSDLSDGTITISNIGSLYKEQKGYFGLLEIIPPQAFAIGLGAVQEKPGIYRDCNGKKSIGIRKVLPMCLVFDHRAIDFSDLVPFLKELDKKFSTSGIISEWLKL